MDLCSPRCCLCCCSSSAPPPPPQVHWLPPRRPHLWQPARDDAAPCGAPAPWAAHSRPAHHQRRRVTPGGRGHLHPRSVHGAAAAPARCVWVHSATVAADVHRNNSQFGGGRGGGWLCAAEVLAQLSGRAKDPPPPYRLILGRRSAPLMWAQPFAAPRPPAVPASLPPPLPACPPARRCAPRPHCLCDGAGAAAAASAAARAAAGATTTAAAGNAVEPKRREEEEAAAGRPEGLRRRGRGRHAAIPQGGGPAGRRRQRQWLQPAGGGRGWRRRQWQGRAGALVGAGAGVTGRAPHGRARVRPPGPVARRALPAGRL